jgi:hypothetical protein
MVSREAIQATDRHHTRSDKKPDNPRYYGSRLSRNAWQIASGWAEVFAPVLWEHVEGELKIQERATSPYPKVLLLDDIPVNRASGEGGKLKRDWFVLVASQMLYQSREGSEIPDRLVKLRLVRGSATNTAVAWRLLLSELDYTPDYVVADAGSGLQKAVRDHYGHGVVIIPSLFHVREAVHDGLYKTANARVDSKLHPALEAHLVGLRRYELSGMTGEGWGLWWDNLTTINAQLGLPAETVANLRRRYEATVRDLLPVMRDHPEIPWSTGGFEVALRQKIKPFLDGRGHALANVERTNRLFDLAVCYDHGLFNSMSHVIELLRADNERFYGWATAQRAVADRKLTVNIRADGTPVQKSYSSLRDQLALLERARKEGVA